METKKGTKTLPVDEPDGIDSVGELAMEVDEVALETKFSSVKIKHIVHMQNPKTDEKMTAGTNKRTLILITMRIA